MNCFLLTGSDLTNLKKEALVLTAKYQQNLRNLDFHYFWDAKSLGIDTVKNIIKLNQLSSFGQKYKVFFVHEANKLTIIAQNALLKTLEEAREKSIFILTCQSLDLLIPTLVSRCQLVKLKTATTAVKVSDSISSDLKIALSGSLERKFSLAQNTAPNPQTALDWLTKIILILKEELLIQKDSRQIYKFASYLKKMLFAQKLIESNTNPRLTLENLFLKL